jgi:hypothetical protein
MKVPKPAELCVGEGNNLIVYDFSNSKCNGESHWPSNIFGESGGSRVGYVVEDLFERNCIVVMILAMETTWMTYHRRENASYRQ